MNIPIEPISVPLFDDGQGGLRVTGTRVLLERIVHAFEDGATPEGIVQSYDTLHLDDVYAVLAWYLRHKAEVEDYLQKRAADAEAIRRKIEAKQPVRAEPAPAIPALLIDSPSLEGARKSVRSPAIAILVTGIFGMLSSGFLTFANVLHQFGHRPETSEAVQEPVSDSSKSEKDQQPDGHRNRDLTGIFVFLSLSLSSMVAIWAAANMIRLRSYWLSVAGSIAILPGSGLFCFVGLPIGIWGIIVLFTPEVSSAFR
jgi:uncharacterized protein (DUF433 family)